MQYSDYEKKYNIGLLRRKLSLLGGTPGLKNKQELILEIMRIENGEVKPKRSGRGRPNLARTASASLAAPKDEDSNIVYGVLELVAEGYGFLRAENCDNSAKDSFIAKPTIRANYLREGDFVKGRIAERQESKLPEVIEVYQVNGLEPDQFRPRFESLMPTYPNRRITLENEELSLRVVDIFSPIGYGQRGLIVAPPKTGKTTLLKNIALSIENNHPEIVLLVFLVDERPEEVTDFKSGLNSEVIYSTFDSSPEHHIRIAELLMKRAKTLVESGLNVVILMDSITKLTRAYNSALPSSGKVLSGGIDPQALLMPKKFFGLARNTQKGSLTILATALVETGSRMDDVIFEEFKGTGNMEIVLSRALAERRVFPAVDIKKSGTRKEELLLSKAELDASYKLRRQLTDLYSVEQVLEVMANTETNKDLVDKLDVWLKYINRD